jgi:hypothetical protein
MGFSLAVDAEFCLKTHPAPSEANIRNRVRRHYRQGYLLLMGFFPRIPVIDMASGPLR